VYLVTTDREFNNVTAPYLQIFFLANSHCGCTWHGCNNCLGDDLLFGVTGVKMNKNILGQPQRHKL